MIGGRAPTYPGTVNEELLEGVDEAGEAEETAAQEDECKETPSSSEGQKQVISTGTNPRFVPALTIESESPSGPTGAAGSKMSRQTTKESVEDTVDSPMTRTNRSRMEGGLGSQGCHPAASLTSQACQPMGPPGYAGSPSLSTFNRRSCSPESLSYMVATELREAERMLASSHQSVISMLSGRPHAPLNRSEGDHFFETACAKTPRAMQAHYDRSPMTPFAHRPSIAAASAGLFRRPVTTPARRMPNTLHAPPPLLPPESPRKADVFELQVAPVLPTQGKSSRQAGGVMNMMHGTVSEEPNEQHAGVSPSTKSSPLGHSETGSNFELFPCWQSKGESSVSKAAKAGMKRCMNTQLPRSDSAHSYVDTLQEEKWQSLVIPPTSAVRVLWDILSLGLVAYDIAGTPMQFFELDATVFMDVMIWFSRIFWTFDLPISFFTGYLLHDGFIMLKLRSIVMHYVTTWFPIDFFFVACDWAELFLPAPNGKDGHIVQSLRMIRLLRIVRMREIIKVFTFRITSEKFTIMADIAKILCFIIAVAHLMACFWYGICNVDSRGEDSWITNHDLEGTSVKYRYVMSMHWSLSQFQGGMDEIRAHNFHERVFNVVVFLMSFMVAAVCVSGLTSSMTRLDILASHQSRQLSVLRRYLIQNGISDKLALRVQRNALHAISEQQRLMAEHTVELLTVISDPLRADLHFEMYSPVLEVHAFFDQYIQECPHVVHQICHRAMASLLVSYGDVVFNMGEIPEYPQMYIVCHGGFEYQVDTETVTEVCSEDFVSEAALWIHWMHRGMLQATMDGRLLVMDARTFQQIVCQFDHQNFDPKAYAKDYVRRLNLRHENGIEITDLPLGPEENAEKTVSDISVSQSQSPGFIRCVLSSVSSKKSIRSFGSTPSRPKSVFFEGKNPGRSFSGF